MLNNDQAIIIDNGSYWFKAGFSGEKVPYYLFPSVVGRYSPLEKKIDVYIGNDACEKMKFLVFKYPVTHGFVKNWEDMEKILHHTMFDQLHVDPSEHPVLITERARNSKECRERMTELMFETFNIPSFYIGNQSLFSLISSGKKTGIVLNIGDGLSEIVPFFDGFLIPRKAKIVNVGGDAITNAYMNKKELYNLNYQKKEFYIGMKENLGYIALNYNDEIHKDEYSIEKTYKFFDGKEITLSQDRFIIPEGLFRPHFLRINENGVDYWLFSIIQQCDMEFRKDLYSNILLSGGSTMFKGFKERLQKEIDNLVNPTINVKIESPENRNIATWIGASIFASQNYFSTKSISRFEYNESGKIIINQKCPRIE